MGYKVKLTELQREGLIEVVRNGKQQATPKHGSWLNMAEIELSHLSGQRLIGWVSQ